MLTLSIKLRPTGSLIIPRLLTGTLSLLILLGCFVDPIKENGKQASVTIYQGAVSEYSTWSLTFKVRPELDQ